MGTMKNNDYNMNQHTFAVMDASSFVSVLSDALIPDIILAHYSQETPWFVKQAVEMLFFDGREMGDLEDAESADAFVINALIAMQRDIKAEYGEADWEGMIQAYIMPDSYTEMFQTFADAGSFSAAYEQHKQQKREVSPWEQRGINLN